MSIASSTSTSSSPLDFLRLKPQKPKTGLDQTDAEDALKPPSADLLRMIQGVMKPSKPEKSSPADPSQAERVIVRLALPCSFHRMQAVEDVSSLRATLPGLVGCAEAVDQFPALVRAL